MANIELLHSNSLSQNLEIVRAALNAPTTAYGDKAVNQLGYLSKYAQINGKSRFKPCKTNQTTQLSESDRKALNWGNFINTYASAFELAQAINAGTAFGYNRLTTGDRCRLFDFNGYNHNAGDWCVPNWNNPLNREYNSGTRHYPLLCDEGLTMFSDILSLGATAGKTLSLGWLLSENPFTSVSASLLYYQPLTDLNTHSIEDYVGENQIDVIVNTSMPANTTFYAYLVLTTYVNGTRGTLYPSRDLTGYEWIPIPYSVVKTIAIKPAVTPVVPATEDLAWTLVDAVWEGQAAKTISSLLCTIANTGTSKQTLVIKSITYQNEIVYSYEDAGEVGWQHEIAAGGDLNLDLCRNGDIIAIPYGSDTDIAINYMALGSTEASFVITLFK